METTNFTTQERVHLLDLNDRPWQAIKKGTKKVEVRANGASSGFDHSTIQARDTIRFLNTTTGEILDTTVLRVQHYPDVRELLKHEGTERTLSSGKNLEGGIESIHSISGYKEAIEKNGVFAIEVIPE